MHVEVPGVDVSQEPFLEVLVATGGRGLVLVAATCCAAVALPGLEDSEASWDLCAVTLAPARSTTFVKVAWHPLSDAHLGVLSSDGSWALVNLSSSASVTDPELYFHVFEETKEDVVDFTFGCFGSQLSPTPEEAWLCLSVLFLGSSGRLSLRNPVLPSVAVMPQAMLNALAADPNDWLREALLTGQALEVLENSICVARHNLHLHAKGPYIPAEQMVEEVLPDGPLSPQSARHTQSSYCSVQFLTLSPLVIIARSTKSGLIQLVALETAPGPSFSLTKMAACSLEEIDTMCSTSLRMTCLSRESPSFLAYSNSLVAAVDVSWARQESGQSGQSGSSHSTITTLAEIRSQDAGSEFAGLQLVDGRGLLLRVERRSSRSPISLQVLDLPQKCGAGTGAGAAGGLGTGEDRENRERQDPQAQVQGSLKRLLLSPIPRGPRESREKREEKAEDSARCLAQFQAQLASLHPRQDLLQHLADSLPARVRQLQQLQGELSSDGKGSDGFSEGARHAAQLRERQQALRRRQKHAASALGAELELRALNSVSNETPRLFARFHELRRAAELLRTGLQASKDAKDASNASFSQPGPNGRSLSLQKSWTGTTAEHLQLQAQEAEAVVEAAAARWL
ncbi:NUP88 [Symbiodinium natans]|uniref:NUP88 protein n=1 Tax=Symbiodinium natans TaxID=878477 RepID=A0A812RKV7_9DINO|nr:NUP88 [Symbiodinium natans]